MRQPARSFSFAPGRISHRDAVERRVDDSRAMFKYGNLIFVLDRACVLHDALAIGNGVTVSLHGQQDLRLDDVDTDADLALVEFEVAQHHVEVFEEAI